MGYREEGAAAPNWRLGQEQPQPQDASGQRNIHLNWSNFMPEFSGKPERMQKHIYCIQMIGWMPTTLLKICRYKNFILHHWEKQDYGTIL